MLLRRIYGAQAAQAFLNEAPSASLQAMRPQSSRCAGDAAPLREARTFIQRLEERRHEESTAVDTIERAKDEAGVDASGMIRGTI